MPLPYAKHESDTYRPREFGIIVAHPKQLSTYY